MKQEAFVAMEKNQHYLIFLESIELFILGRTKRQALVFIRL
ncbi:hypothetical protein HMPREF0352_1186 [Enterococcus faecium TX1330]|nr:hypothetical protein HMPREF0352_1186 [Enterococcus faecium TX1330]